MDSPLNRQGRQRMSKSTNPIPGIRLTWRDFGYGYLYPYLRCVYKGNDGQRKHSSVSIDKHGFNKAVEKVHALRKSSYPDTTPSLQTCIKKLSALMEKKGQ